MRLDAKDQAADMLKRNVSNAPKAKALPIAQAGELFKRRAAETANDALNAKLQQESFSGKSQTTVLEDFYATNYLGRHAAFGAEEAGMPIERSDAAKSLKYERKASRGRTMAKIRKSMLACHQFQAAMGLRSLLAQWQQAFARHPVPIGAGRSPERKEPRKKRFHKNTKAAVC